MSISKFVIIVFPEEAQTYHGLRALQELHAEGSLTLYATAVVAKEMDGKVSIKQVGDEGALGLALGTVTGGLIGLIGGPVGVAAGLAAGAMIGSLGDLYNAGLGSDFVAKVATELSAGKSALIAEIAESWTVPLDTRMEVLGGVILRTWRADFEDEQIAREIAARNLELEQLKAEYAQTSQAMKARLSAKLDQAKADLKKAEERARAKIESLDSERKSKLAALEQQFATARDNAREDITMRIDALRVDFEKRTAELKEAWNLTREALAA